MRQRKKLSKDGVQEHASLGRILALESERHCRVCAQHPLSGLRAMPGGGAGV